MRHHQRLCLLRGNPFCLCDIGQIGFQAGHQAQHPAFRIRNDLDRAARHGRFSSHLLEHVNPVPYGVCQGAPGLHLRPCVPTHQGQHPVHNPRCGFHIFHGFVRTRAVHKGHTAAVYGGLRAQRREIFRGDLFPRRRGGVFRERAAGSACHQRRQYPGCQFFHEMIPSFP